MSLILYPAALTDGERVWARRRSMRLAVAEQTGQVA